MFVAVTCELASDDHRMEVYELLEQYGFTRVMRDVFESATIREQTLSRLKRDIDKATDFYDKVRLYQYPLDGTLVLTFLSEKQWKRTIIEL